MPTFFFLPHTDQFDIIFKLSFTQSCETIKRVVCFLKETINVDSPPLSPFLPLLIRSAFSIPLRTAPDAWPGARRKYQAGGMAPRFNAKKGMPPGELVLPERRLRAHG